MRTITDSQSRLHAANAAARWVRVDLEDAVGAFQNMRSYLGRDWLIGAEWGESEDNNAADATIQLRREHGGLSIAPKMTNARANSGGALIAAHRLVRIYGAITAAYAAPESGDWVLLFSGRIAEWDASDSAISLVCVDRFNDLKDRWIEDAATYSDAVGEAVEDVMQEIIDDNGSLFTLYTPSSPGWMVTAFQSQTQSIADQLTMLSDQIGWSLRWKWDSGTSAYRLTFYSVDRASTTSLYTFNNGKYFDVTSYGLAIADVRNVIEVTYSDPADLDSTGAPIRKTATASDATSISDYGRRWMAVSEDASSNIDTAAEAQDLADRCLADLKDPVVTMTVETPFAFFVELADIYTFTADGARFSSDTDIAVTGYRHRFTLTEARTTITGTATTARSGRARWYRVGAIPGRSVLHDMTGPIPPIVTVTEQNGTLAAALGLTRTRHVEHEVHVGPVGFTPDTASGSTTFASRMKGTTTLLAANLSNLPIGEPVDIVAYAVDSRGNRSTGTRSANRTARRYGPHMMAANARIGATFNGGIFTAQTRGTSYPPDGWHMVTGTWATDANVDTGGTYAEARTSTQGLLLLNTGTATKLKSDLLPVTYGRMYQVDIELRASSIGAAVSLGLVWLDSAGSVISTETLYSSPLSAVDTWQFVGAVVGPPTTARFARIDVSKAASAFYVLVDRVLFNELEEPDAEINGVRLVDDFEGNASPGALPWQLAQLGSDVFTYPSTVAKVTAATSTYTWTERGIVRISTPAQANYGGVLILGSAAEPQFYELPPVGTMLRWRVRINGTATNFDAWVGLFSTEATWPDGPMSNSIKGCGVRVSATGASANWKVIARDGTSETSVDLGVAASATWRTIGFRRTVAGIQPLLGDHPVGAEITTNIPTGTGLSLMAGVYTINGTAKDLDIDFMQLLGRFRRYDP